MSANNKQISGNHYKTPIECWDYLVANNIGYLEGNAIKYLSRWKKKNGLEDLRKAQHYIEKLIEVELASPTVSGMERFPDISGCLHQTAAGDALGGFRNAYHVAKQDWRASDLLPNGELNNIAILRKDNV